MHKVIRNVSRTQLSFQPRIPCRIISGRRFPFSSRSFHSTRIRKTSIAENPAHELSTKDGDLHTVADEETSLPIDWTKYEEALNHGRTLFQDAENHWPGIIAHSRDIAHNKVSTVGAKNTGRYGSWRRRSRRNVTGDSVLTLPTLPEWFLHRNIFPVAESPELDDLIHIDPAFENVEAEEYVQAVKSAAEKAGEEGIPRYRISKGQFEEITALATAGLNSASVTKVEDEYYSKPHLNLMSSHGGTTGYLNRVGQAVAKSVHADVIVLDPVTISELAKEFKNDLPAGLARSLQHLSYDVYLEDSDLKLEEEEDDEGAEDDPESPAGIKPLKGLFDMIKSRRSKSSSSVGMYQFDVMMPGAGGKDRPNVIGKIPGMHAMENDEFMLRGAQPAYAVNTTPVDAEKDVQIRLFLEAVLDSIALVQQHNSLTNISDRLIVLFPDFVTTRVSKAGAFLQDKMQEVIQERRNEGQQILLMGLSSSDENGLNSRSSVNAQIDSEVWWRNIVTISNSWHANTIFDEDAEDHIRQINVRHLQDMLKGLAWSQELLAEWCWQPSRDISQTEFADYFDNAVWSADRLNRVAAVALGLASQMSSRVDLKLIGRTLKLIHEDDAKKWALMDALEEEESGEECSTNDVSTVVAKARKSANSHEKKLLHGVIDRKDIKTTFSSVHVPGSTIRALKTLTSLSLQRPEAFSYGVLATDKIPGLLLYGPPGTGKTLLAKAVAGESGATVLEVSGSDIYNMYVGEGEKNVRAIFSLAMKLSPCVVFIDEADAILGSRSSHGNRTTHRELINQFLREWDGLSSKNTSAFIMVATNRPFDLDDAVLRRLPRRLLVDLPTEKDREAILKIHLKHEKLDDTVSITSLASRTPFYSGSDLKNVCVAAALQAVQEEYDAKLEFENLRDAAATSTDMSSHPEAAAPAVVEYTYPPVRTLNSTHFEKALADISASISEDMSSLVAIRKFDEKYGDKRGKKKKGGLGFGTRNEADAERERREEGRVRREILSEIE